MATASVPTSSTARNLNICVAGYCFAQSAVTSVKDLANDESLN
jgi:hypothetical protein